MWVAFLGRRTAEPTGFAAIATSDPEIATVDKRNVLLADGGLAQQAGALCLDRTIADAYCQQEAPMPPLALQVLYKI
jgi:hypothetical protein